MWEMAELKSPAIGDGGQAMVSLRGIGSNSLLDLILSTLLWQKVKSN